MYRNDTEDLGFGRFVVELESAEGADAIGVLVTLETSDGKTMVRQVKGGTSSHSQDYSREVYFGLGNASVEKVTVRWPTAYGVSQVFNNPSGSRLVAAEPGAIAPPPILLSQTVVAGLLRGAVATTTNFEFAPQEASLDTLITERVQQRRPGRFDSPAVSFEASDQGGAVPSQQVQHQLELEPLAVDQVLEIEL